MPYVLPCTSDALLDQLPDGSVDLLLTDPPYHGIVEDSWDNQWADERAFAHWLSGIFLRALPKLTPTGSLVFFGGLGRHGSHPLFRVVTALENGGYTFRNWVTWKKRRAYGKSHDYLYTREEILWFSRSPERTGVTFNKPYTEERRGYEGYEATVVAGYVDLCYHTPHGWEKARTNPQDSCLSPGSQAQSKRSLLRLLRQADILERPGIQEGQASEVVATEQGASSRLHSPEKTSTGPGDRSSRSSKTRREETRDTIRVDRRRLEGCLDRDMPCSWNPNSTEHQEMPEFDLGGSDRQLCWVCTWEYLRDVLEGQQVEGRRLVGRTEGSSSILGGVVCVEVTDRRVKYPALSEFKRVGNVWTDIDPVIDDCPELMRPERSCQKPQRLMDRLVAAHSNEGDLVVDPFSGWGSTGVSAVALGRRFIGCEAIEADARAADERVRNAAPIAAPIFEVLR